MDDDKPLVITVNQVVAWNMAWYRRAAGLTQKQLGDRIGWTNTAVSEAERSWDGRRVREFDAQALADISLALRIPLIALLLPPEEDDAARISVAKAGGNHSLGDFLALVVMPDFSDGSPVIKAVLRRLEDAAGRYLDPRWAAEVARWLLETESSEMLDDHARRLRARQAEAMRNAEEFGSLASAIENRGRLS